MRELTTNAAASDHPLRNLKTVEIRVTERLNQLECHWLIGQLVRKLGVVAAFHASADSRRVFVNYDADVVSPVILLDFLYECGLTARLAMRRDKAFIQSTVSTAPAVGDHHQKAV